MNFEAKSVEWTLKARFLEKPEKCQIFTKCPFKIDEIETGTK